MKKVRLVNSAIAFLVVVGVPGLVFDAIKVLFYDKQGMDPHRQLLAVTAIGFVGLIVSISAKK